MPLLVKMMKPDGLDDYDTRSGHTLFANVQAVTFQRTPDGPVADITFSDMSTESYAIQGNCYVMNENGKTVSSFGVEPPPGTALGRMAETLPDISNYKPPMTLREIAEAEG